MTNVVEQRRDGAVVTVILNRPDKMNALNLPVWRGLAEVFEAINADDGIRCVILRGAGFKDLWLQAMVLTFMGVIAILLAAWQFVRKQGN